LAVIAVSCADKAVPTFTVPSTYRFNSPTLVDKTYYVYDNGGYRLVTDTLDDFLVDNEVLGDSLNQRLRKVFINETITSISFLTTNESQITFAMYDPLTSTYINPRIVNSKYRFEGNDLKIDSLPNAKMNIDGDFYEVRQKYHAADRVYRWVKTDTTLRVRDYDLRPYQYDDDKSYINFMSLQRPDYSMDTLAIYDVDVIYSKY
jgi:hypothetical protein